MFYLIFGQAYSRNYLDVDTYNKLCVNKNTKIHMPKQKTEDDTDIVAFSHEECARLDPAEPKLLGAAGVVAEVWSDGRYAERVLFKIQDKVDCLVGDVLVFVSNFQFAS